jgi:hypothetical protein
MYPLIQILEEAISPVNRYVGMFMTVELEKQ